MRCPTRVDCFYKIHRQVTGETDERTDVQTDEVAVAVAVFFSVYLPGTIIGIGI